jgi:hypothetical protein
LAASLIAAPAMAGNKGMKGPDGTKLRVDCTSSGCTVKEKKPGGKWGTVHKGPGGSQNYEKLVADYAAKGFK